MVGFLKNDKLLFQRKKLCYTNPMEKRKEKVPVRHKQRTMDKKKGYLSLLGILIALIAGSYICIFGVDENKAG